MCRSSLFQRSSHSGLRPRQSNASRIGTRKDLRQPLCWNVSDVSDVGNPGPLNASKVSFAGDRSLLPCRSS